MVSTAIMRPAFAYLGEPVKDKMIAGEGMLAVMYSGDAQFCQFYNEDLMYAINQGSAFALKRIMRGIIRDYVAARTAGNCAHM